MNVCVEDYLSDLLGTAPVRPQPPPKMEKIQPAVVVELVEVAQEIGTIEMAGIAEAIEAVSAAGKMDAIEAVEVINAAEEVEAVELAELAEPIEAIAALDVAEEVEAVAVVDALDAIEVGDAAEQAEAVETVGLVETAEAVELAEAVEAIETIQTVQTIEPVLAVAPVAQPEAAIAQAAPLPPAAPTPRPVAPPPPPSPTPMNAMPLPVAAPQAQSPAVALLHRLASHDAYEQPERRAAERATRWLRMRCDEQHYAVELLKIQEVVLPATLLPLRGAAAHVLGVMNLRGQIVPVIDVGLYLGRQAIIADASTRIVVVEEHGETLGLRVSAVEDVAKLTDAQIEAPESTRACGINGSLFRGVSRTGGLTLILLDATSILK